MSQLQETLPQAVGDGIYLFASWDQKIDVRFRFWAPRNTVVE